MLGEAHEQARHARAVGERWREVSQRRTGLFGSVRRAFHQLRLRLFPVRDPWQRLPYEAPLSLFGDGARHGFDWVFEGESDVTVQDLDAILDWLSGCHYEPDATLFRESDYWQHPHTFEQLRRGDCEDFALWAWRKLVELGVDADFVVGRRVPPIAENSRHAWVLFRDADNEFVLEPIARDRVIAVRHASAVRGEYIPECGVGRDRTRFYFAGYAYFLQNPHLGRPGADPGAPAGRLSARGITPAGAAPRARQGETQRTSPGPSGVTRRMTGS